MTRARQQTVQSLTREKQRFLKQLFLKISGFAQEKIFSNSFYAIVVAILEEFESADQLATFIQKHGKDSLEDGNSIVAEIGDINRFPFQASLAKYAGLTWIQHHPLDFSP